LDDDEGSPTMLNLHLRHRPAGELPAAWEAGAIEHYLSSVPVELPNGRTAAFTVDGVPLDVQPVDVFGVTPMVRRARVPLGVHTYRIASSSVVFTRAIEVPTSAVGAAQADPG
jgi:hypothetical protein